MRLFRLSTVLGVVATAVGLAVAPIAPAAASTTRDSATAGGYHFQTLRPADVIAGSRDNNLVIAYTAGQRLRDGTIRIVLPGHQWSTPLHAIAGPLRESAAYDRAVVVRPAPSTSPPLPEPTIDPADACGWPAATPLQWTVQWVLGSQVITVRHVDCAPGQQLFVRIKAIHAPSQVGRYHLPIVASDHERPARLSVATIEVVPIPRVALRVTAPTQVTAGVPFPITVRAVEPDGRTATGYRGAVAVVSEDLPDCSLSPPDQTVAHEFTAADAGVAVITVRLDTALAHLLRVYDVANKARPGVSGRFDVVVSSPPSASCPASYH